MMAGTFSWEINNCLVLVIRTPYQGLKPGFWVSLLERSLEEYFLGF